MNTSALVADIQCIVSEGGFPFWGFFKNPCGSVAEFRWQNIL